MKRVLFSMVMLLCASFAFAQKSAVKEAKSIANGVNPDFKKAEQLINGALTNAETKDDPETWNVAGFVQQRHSAKEMENAYLRKPYDTLAVFNCALDMCRYYFKCDELAQQPNEKGKIKNKYRKSNAAVIMTERGNLINGGIQYYNYALTKEGDAAKADNAKALEFFAMYIDVAQHPMMEAQAAELKADTLLPQIAYYAAMVAVKNENHDAVIKYAPYAENHPELGKFAMEFVSTALKAKGENDKWVESLQRGLEKYPDYPFFFGSLIDYYSNNEKYDEAFAFAQRMLDKDPNNTLYLYVMGYLNQNIKKYDEAITWYEKAIASDANYAEAYSNLGLVYRQQAQEFGEKATTDVNDPKYAEEQKTLRTFFEKAKPHYEKARQLKPDNRDLWLQGLYSVYYNLNMGPEFQEIESMM